MTVARRDAITRSWRLPCRRSACIHPGALMLAGVLAACSEDSNSVTPPARVSSTGTPAFAVVPAVSKLLGRATFSDHHDPNFQVKRMSPHWKIDIKAKPGFDLAVQIIDFPVGSQSTWHTHPGPGVHPGGYRGDIVLRVRRPHVYAASCEGAWGVPRLRRPRASRPQRVWGSGAERGDVLRASRRALKNDEPNPETVRSERRAGSPRPIVLIRG